MPPRRRDSMAMGPTLAPVPQSMATLDDAAFVGRLMDLEAGGGLGEVKAALAMALGAEDYRTNLRHGVDVEWHMHIIQFSVQQGYNPTKTMRVLQWLTMLRSMVVQGGGEVTPAVSQMVRNFLVNEVARSHHFRYRHTGAFPASGAGPVVGGAPSEAADMGASVLQFSSAASVAATDHKKDGKRPARAAGDAAAASAQPAALPRVVSGCNPPVLNSPGAAAVMNSTGGGARRFADGILASPSSFDELLLTAVGSDGVAGSSLRADDFIHPDEVGPLATFVADGMLRHASLFHYVATRDRAVCKAKGGLFNVKIETPIGAPPLSQATVQVLYEKQRSEDLMRRAAAFELAQAEEARQALEEHEERLRQEAEKERLRQEEAEMHIFFDSRERTQHAVEDVRDQLENQVTVRQRNILIRLAALERVLGTSEQPATA